MIEHPHYENPNRDKEFITNTKSGEVVRSDSDRQTSTISNEQNIAEKERKDKKAIDYIRGFILESEKYFMGINGL